MNSKAIEICKACADDILIAFAGNKKIEVRYLYTVADGGKCGKCGRKFSELKAYRLEKKSV